MTDNAKQVAQEFLDKWMTAFNAGHAEAVANLYTEDAYFSGPMAGNAIGRASVRKAMEGTISAGFKMKGTITEARMIGADTMVAIGEYTISGDGKEMNGRWGSTSVRQGGDWRCTSHIANLPVAR